MAPLHHPGIVALYQFHEENPTALVMEYVSGTTLEKLVEADGRLGLDRTCRVVEVIASALDCIHAQGIIHRDIKPSNILIPPRGPAKLTDFGVAYIDDETPLTVMGDILGTIEYVSPEQVHGNETPDERTDVYSLAAVTYFALTGTPPFRAADTSTQAQLSVMHRQVFAEPAPLRLHREDLPLAVEQVVLRGLAKAPDDRYQSAGQMAAALRDAVEAAPEVVEERATALATRRGALATAALIFLLLTTGLWRVTHHPVQPQILPPSPIRQVATVPPPTPPVVAPPRPLVPLPVPIKPVPAVVKSAPAIEKPVSPIPPPVRPAIIKPAIIKPVVKLPPAVARAIAPKRAVAPPHPAYAVPHPIIISHPVVVPRPPVMAASISSHLRSDAAARTVDSKAAGFVLVLPPASPQAPSRPAPTLAPKPTPQPGLLKVFAKQNASLPGQPAKVTSIPASVVTVDGKPVPALARGHAVALPAGAHSLGFFPAPGTRYGPHIGVRITITPHGYITKQILLPVQIAPPAPPRHRPVPAAPARRASVAPLPGSVYAASPARAAWLYVYGCRYVNRPGAAPRIALIPAQSVTIDGVPVGALASRQWAGLRPGTHLLAFYPQRGSGSSAHLLVTLSPRSHHLQRVVLPAAP